MNWLLLQKYLSDECTSKEKEVIEEWLAEDRDHIEFYESLVKVWGIKPYNDVNVDINTAWKKLEQEMPSSEEEVNEESNPFLIARKNNIFVKFAVAASIIFMAFLLYQYMPEPIGKSVDPEIEQVTMETFSTQKAQRTTLRLTDGSIVHLNVASSLKIDSSFGDSVRAVYLDGEAYFDVVPNSDLPFIVHSKNTSTRVLGTKFNVKAYSQDEKVQVAVKEGKVALQDNEGTARDIITKNRIGVLGADGRVAVRSVSSLDSYLGWKVGELVFENSQLHEIIIRLERWYNVEIVVEDQKLLSQRMTVRFKNDTLDEVLAVLSTSLNINYDYTGRKVRLISPI